MDSEFEIYNFKLEYRILYFVARIKYVVKNKKFPIPYSIFNSSYQILNSKFFVYAVSHPAIY